MLGEGGGQIQTGGFLEHREELGSETLLSRG